MAELRVYFFRHGLTYGNVEARMCGRTNTLVCRQGWEELYHLKETYGNEIEVKIIDCIEYINKYVNKNKNII